MAPTKTLALTAMLAVADLSGAFMPAMPCGRANQVVMRAEEGMSRRDALGSIGLGMVGLLGLAANSAPARAGWLNSDSLPEVIKPKDAEIDQEQLGSAEVQENLKLLRKYKESIKQLKSALSGNTQADLRSIVQKDFDFADLRDSLNKVNNAVFSEDTQRGTDRLVRIILQDVNELEMASRIKPGSQRSDNKVALINKKLVKLDNAFAELLAFF